MSDESQQIILSAIEELRSDLKDYAVTQNKHDVYISGMKHILYDNGQLGLVSKHNATANKIDNHIANHDDAKKSRQWLIPVLISLPPIIISILAFLKK